MSSVTSAFGSSLNSSHESHRLLHLAPDPEVPGGQVGVWHRSRVEYRPLVRQVLAGRQPRRIEPASTTFFSARDLKEGHAAYTSHMNGVALRPRSYVAVRGPDAEEFLQRMVVERRLRRTSARRSY